MTLTSSKTIGIPKEIRTRETRVATSPDSVKKFIKMGFKVRVEKDAGTAAGYPDESFKMDGVEIVDKAGAFGSDIVLKIHRPAADETTLLKKDALLFSLLEPYTQDGYMDKLAAQGVDAIAMELIPRTTRAQSMDVLSSQANIAGYRAVIEGAAHYGRFFPMMMTSAGSAKQAKCVILGVGVAGLQAIGTARRLGASVEAYDVRPETREQAMSLGAKWIDLDIGESGSGTGGYAKELSDEAKKKQQQLLTERLMKADLIITTANIPGRKAPVLVTEEAVKGMRAGSVIVDMAAANGGNCPLSEPDTVVVKHGVKLVGVTNYPALVPTDSSSFYGRNLLNLLQLFVTEDKQNGNKFAVNLEDDIIAASLVTYQGAVRFGKK